MKNEEYEEAAEEVRITEEQAKYHIEMMESLERLYNNKDFKKVFMDGYFKEEASRLVLLRADHNIQQEEKTVQSIDDKIIGIGELRQFMLTVFARGRQMREAVAEANEYAENVYNDKE